VLLPLSPPAGDFQQVFAHGDKLVSGWDVVVCVKFLHLEVETLDGIEVEVIGIALVAVYSLAIDKERLGALIAVFVVVLK
jgi:hypothetical protein